MNEGFNNSVWEQFKSTSGVLILLSPGLRPSQCRVDIIFLVSVMLCLWLILKTRSFLLRIAALAVQKLFVVCGCSCSCSCDQVIKLLAQLLPNCYLNATKLLPTEAETLGGPGGHRHPWDFNILETGDTFSTKFATHLSLSEDTQTLNSHFSSSSYHYSLYMIHKLRIKISKFNEVYEMVTITLLKIRITNN